MLTACTLGPDFVRPQAPEDTHYNAVKDPADTVRAENISQHFEKGGKPIPNWWKLYRSERLDETVAEAISHNPTLEAAEASLKTSYDNLRAGYGIFYPQASLDLAASRQKFSPERFGSNAPAPIFNLVTLSASVSYALDVFGGEHRLIENLQAQTDQQRAILQGSYLVLVGNIVNTSIAAAAYRDMIVETMTLIALQKDAIAIVGKQANAGTVPYAGVLGLQSQLSAFEASLPGLTQKLDQSEHLLANLAGLAPSEWKPPEFTLDAFTLPDNLPLSLPSELVRQRPDILAAEAGMHAASASIGVASAAQFPSFTLGASFGQNSTSMNNLLAKSGSFWSLGSDISTPLFNGGTLAARKQGAIDAYRQSLSFYRQTVISALTQVADTLRALEHDAEALQAQSLGLQAAKDALHLAEINYQAGTVNYLQVLNSEIQYRQARIGYLEASAQRLQDTTAFFVALGGKPESEPVAR
jgi:NodT family efflux transporter outer membrane factor (OMF) lipoprotein